MSRSIGGIGAGSDSFTTASYAIYRNVNMEYGEYGEHGRYK